MPLLRKNRNVQYTLAQEFTFGATDTCLSANGLTVAFNATTGAFDVIGMPVGGTVVGGELVVNTVSNTSGTATVSVGDSLNPTRYLGATTIKTAARTPLVPTGFVTNGEDVRITVANAAADATAGSYTLRVLYLIAGRAHEVQTN